MSNDIEIVALPRDKWKGTPIPLVMTQAGGKYGSILVSFSTGTAEEIDDHIWSINDEYKNKLRKMV